MLVLGVYKQREDERGPVTGTVSRTGEQGTCAADKTCGAVRPGGDRQEPVLRGARGRGPEGQ